MWLLSTSPSVFLNVTVESHAFRFRVALLLNATAARLRISGPTEVDFKVRCCSSQDFHLSHLVLTACLLQHSAADVLRERTTCRLRHAFTLSRGIFLVESMNIESFKATSVPALRAQCQVMGAYTERRQEY